MNTNLMPLIPKDQTKETPAGAGVSWKALSARGLLALNDERDDERIDDERLDEDEPQEGHRADLS